MTAKLCIAMAVYGQPRMLEKQLSSIAGYGEEVLGQLQVIVVDDHGTPAVDPAWCAQFRFDLRVYRVIDDIPWNQMGARNLAMERADPTWCLMIDPDMVFSGPMIDRVLRLTQRLGPRDVVRYGLRHMNNPDGGIDMTSPNTYLIHRDAFLGAGGYDETYRGHKGWSDVQMLDVLRAHYGLNERRDIWADFYSVKQIPDAAVHTLDRSTSHNKRLRIKRQNEARKAGGWPKWVRTKKTPRIQFRWTATYPSS